MRASVRTCTDEDYSISSCSDKGRRGGGGGGVQEAAGVVMVTSGYQRWDTGGWDSECSLKDSQTFLAFPRDSAAPSEPLKGL